MRGTLAIRRNVLSGVVLAACLVASAAAILRLTCLDCRSFWLDEASTAMVLQFSSVGSALEYAHGWPDHPPGTFMLTWALGWLGPTEGPVRLAYAAAGIAGCLALFAIGRRLTDTSGGLAAGGLCAVMPFAVFYAQEARPYVWSMLMAAVIFWLAHRIVTERGLRDWALFGAACVLGAYVSFLLLAVIGAACALIAVDTVVGQLGRRRRREPFLCDGYRVKVVLMTGFIAAVAVGPQAPRLLAFIERGDLSGARFPRDHVPTLAEAAERLRELDVMGWPATLAAIGAIVAILMIWRGRWRAGLIPLLWLAIPLAGFVLTFRGGITLVWSRYFAIVYPAFVLLAALAIWGIARAAQEVAQRLVRWKRQPLRPASWAGAIGSLILVSAIASTTVPSVVASYHRPKGTDYRAAGALIAAAGRPALVLAAGLHPDWVQLGLGYALWARRLDASVVDARRLDSVAFALLAGRTSVWAASYPSVEGRNSSPGIEVIDFADMVLARPSEAGGSTVDDAVSLLRWAAADRPELMTTSDLVASLSPGARVGPELLVPPPMAQPDSGGPLPLGSWALQPGSRVADDSRGFVVEPAGAQVDVRLVTDQVAARHRYRLTFETRGDPGSVMRVFFASIDPVGVWLDIQPSGSGFKATGGDGWSLGGFAFVVPDQSSQALVTLRTEPSGRAEFRSVSLREILG